MISYKQQLNFFHVFLCFPGLSTIMLALFIFLAPVPKSLYSSLTSTEKRFPLQDGHCGVLQPLWDLINFLVYGI